MTRLVRATVSSLRLRSVPSLDPGTDTGTRLLAGQTANALGETFDKQWLFVTAPIGYGWASAAYLSDAPAVPPITVVRLRVPSGKAEITALFGEPCQARCEAGRVTLPAPLPLSWAVDQRVTRFACHELMVPVFTDVFDEIHRRGLWSLLEDFGGCYNCREQRGKTTKASTHSWGIGIDVNARQNPLGAKPRMPEPIVAIFREHGFQWGGTWSRPDGMHYQYATQY